MLTAFYFLIQETTLSILVALRFQPNKIAAICIGVIYSLLMLFYMAYLSTKPLWFFPNIQTQYVNIWRKLLVPVFVIVPPEITFIILILLLGFIFFESGFDYKGGHFKLFSRITVYKLLEFIVVFLCLIYYAVEIGQNTFTSVGAIRIFVSIFIIAFFICFAV